jgi:23S rRNA pseudouridine2604 synthase
MEPQRISKLLAQRGLCSRREADRFIELGWVQVDGVVARIGAKAMPDQEITIDARVDTALDQQVTILVHKPIGIVSGQAEDGYADAASLIQRENHFAGDQSGITFSQQHLQGLAPAGRLDIDSTGLLVLTQNGVIARTLIGNDARIEKEYLVRVEGAVTDRVLARLRHGLYLDDRPLRPAQVTVLNDDQLKFILKEGRKRQIRRMCELVGLRVVGLKRVRVGRVLLRDLPKGQWRYLEKDESF